MDSSRSSGTPRVSERVLLESDPYTSYGLDIRIVRDAAAPSRRSDRDWKRDLERMIGTAFTVRGRRGGDGVELTLSGRVIEYRDAEGELVGVERTSPPPAAPEFADLRTVQLRLSRALPLWGDQVRQLGFELPKPYGIGLVTHLQEQEMSIDGVTVNNPDVGGGDVTFVDPAGSGTTNRAQALSVRADVWVLPFLNLDLVAGEVETESDVTLRFTPAFRTLVRLQTGIELREYETLPVTTTSTMLGLGLSTGFQFESLFGALSAQWATTVVNETSSELDILVATFLVGYDFGDIGLRVQTGAQYQDWDQAIRGTIPLGAGRDPLEFDIDLSVDKTTFLVGLYKDIGRHWNVVVLAGFGARDQLTTTVGYRF